MISYKMAMEFIEESNAYGSIYGLEAIRELLRRLGNPQEQLKFIHIGGTNGKGSVVSFLASILIKAGYRTGSYISPVLSDYRERIQINGNYITEDALARGIEKIKKAVDEMKEEGYPRPTVFEIETALGFLYFLEERCELVLLEVGLGGKDDGTNVISTSILTILTSISLDHMHLLGDTIKEIAECKGGIIKEGVPVILSHQTEEAESVIQRICAKNNSPLWITEPDKCIYGGYQRDFQEFSYKEFSNLRTQLMGSYQIENACVCIEAVKRLLEIGFPVSKEALEEGILKARWSGRFERIYENPDIFIDGAHNEDGAAKLMESLDLYFTNRRILYIMGILKDKDYHKMIQLTVPRADKIFTITPDNTRALSADELADEIRRINPNTEAAETLEQAIHRALSEAGKEDVIVAFGSLYYLGELRRLIQEMQND